MSADIFPEHLRPFVHINPIDGRFSYDSRRIKLKSAIWSVDGYKRVNINGIWYRADRVAYALYHGHCPDHIEHVNGILHDNSYSNLRAGVAPQAESTGVGVSWNSKENLWEAHAIKDGVRVSLGLFSSKTIAKMAFENATRPAEDLE